MRLALTRDRDISWRLVPYRTSSPPLGVISPDSSIMAKKLGGLDARASLSLMFLPAQSQQMEYA